MVIMDGRKHRAGKSSMTSIRQSKRQLWANTDLEERPDAVCNVSLYRQADFRSLRSSGIWLKNLERQESA